MKPRMLISAALLCVGLSGCALTPYTTSGYDDYPRSHHEVYYRPAPPVRYVVVERPAPPVRHMVYERPAPHMIQAASPPRGHEERQEVRNDRHHDRSDEHGDHRADRRG